MPKVSVIIPLYNASPYLAELKQVWAQTLSDFELILVDDCSTDDTWELLQRFQADYPERAIILARNERNLGPGGTRNHGLSLSSGQYVIFLDGDDRYEPTLLEKMAAKLDATGADVVCCGLMLHEPDNNTPLIFDSTLIEQVELYNCKGGGTVLSNHSPFTLEQVLIHPSLYPSACNKMVRCSFLLEQNISFPDITFGEDRCWSELIVLTARNIALVNEALYHYQLQQSSISHEKSGRLITSIFAQFEFEYQELTTKALFHKLRIPWLLQYWNTIFFCYHQLEQSPNQKAMQGQLLEQCRDFCDKHNMVYDPSKLPHIERYPYYKLIPKARRFRAQRSKFKSKYQLKRYLLSFHQLDGRNNKPI